jgi:ParB-like chromosome segregation protein Spo0J
MAVQKSTVKKILSVKVSDLTLDPNNARKHGESDVAAIAASLEKFSQQTPIVITSDNVVIKGNGTLMAAMKLNWTHIDAIRTNLTGQQVTAYAIADNQTALNSEWDEERLKELLGDFDAELQAACGFDQEYLLELLEATAFPELEETPEEDKPAEKNKRCKHCGGKL